MAGTVTVYLCPPYGGERKEKMDCAETVLYTGTGGYIIQRSEADRRIFPDRIVRRVRIERDVQFADQS